MIFISAGHNPKGIKTDPGAVAHGHIEADLAVEIRDLVCIELSKLGVTFKKDSDDETLAQYLSRIQTGSGSVVVEFHFDAANGTASGSTAIVEAEADRLDRLFASKLVAACSTALGIRNRGVKSEAETHRGKLGLMREDGIICLLEVGFIDNIKDLNAFQCSKRALALVLAPIIKEFEDLIK
jgi:N-acetylmuramoyl-L-alanine amidase